MAQSTTIKGVVLSEDTKPLEFATAVLLQQKDSVIAQFGLTDKTGGYKINNVPKGDYILQLTFVGYQTFGKNILVDGTQKEIFIDTIILNKASNKLNDVVIEGEKIPVQMNGDTVQYNADAFKTQPNATVEDLLKKLPGVNVDKDGTVKAQGETVTKVTVDGKEFFSDDPKVATKNLPADAVDKVQVFDAKSETADFTGVDDGEHEKTINLKLKEGKKHGVFGNATAGYGTEDRYFGKLSFNRFSAVNKLSVLAVANNTNEPGFSWQDITSFAGGMSGMGDGGLMFNNSMDMASGWMANRKGVTDNVGGGINFNTTAIKKLELNGNYLLNYTDNTLNQISTKEYVNSETGFLSNSDSRQRNYNLSHRLNAKIIFKPNENNKLTIRGNFNLINADNNKYATQENIAGNNFIQSNSQTNTDASAISMKVSATYLKKFSKQGRTFTIDGTWNNRVNPNFTFLNSNSFSIIPDTVLNILEKNILQNQDSRSTRNNYNGRIAYTEPTSPESVLEFSYQRQNTRNTNDKTFYDIDPFDNSIIIINDSLSNNYNNDYLFDRGGIKWRWNHKKMNFSFGGVLQKSELNGNSAQSENTLTRSYLKILPALQLNQKFNNARMNLNYTTNISEPSIDQLQPVVDNSNPLSIYKGNPDLDAAYSHNLSFNYNYFSQYNSIGLWMYSSAYYTIGNIVNSITYDSAFVETTQPVNTDFEKGANAYLSFTFPVNFIKCKVELEPNFELTNGIIYLNGAATGYNKSDNSYGITLGNKKKDDIDWEVGAEYGLTQTNYHNESAQVQEYSYWNYSAEVEADLWKFTLATDVDYNIYNNFETQSVQKIPIWNASLGFQFMKNDRAELELSSYDLLDRDNGITRTASLNYIQQTTVNTLGRYFLLKFTFNLSKLGSNGMGFPGNMKIKMK